MSSITITQRDGSQRAYSRQKLIGAIEFLIGLMQYTHIDVERCVTIVEQSLIDTTSEDLMRFIALSICSLATSHPEYSNLAANFEVLLLHKITSKSFTDTLTRDLEYQVSIYGPGKDTQNILNFIEKHRQQLDSAIVHFNDFKFNYASIKTLLKTYLHRIGDEIIERPQFIYMRQAVQLHHAGDIKDVLETYLALSSHKFTFASPNILNACAVKSQLSSCFLLGPKSDDNTEINAVIHKSTELLMSEGGLGVHLHKVRGSETPFERSGIRSGGVLPVMKMLDGSTVFAGKRAMRKCATAVYLEPWHSDIIPFLNAFYKTGDEKTLTRNLFIALWIPDLFMKRVKDNGIWSLMCPHKCPGMDDVYGDDFVQLYERYESEKKFEKQMLARDLYREILKCQAQNSGPYMLYKDACNRKSNQQNLGTIKCSNLCAEVVENSNDGVAVCNLASINLTYFVTENGYDFKALKEVAKLVTRDLNKVIDYTYGPVAECSESNMRNRSIGIGIQGLADVFAQMDMVFGEDGSRLLSKKISETIYYGAMESSCESAMKDGPYPSYQGSPVSQGILQYDMWNVVPTELWDWGELKAKIAIHGVRNSYVTAEMPTATTAHIMGNNEGGEPIRSNLFTTNVTSGTHTRVNRHLVDALDKLGLWNEDMVEQLTKNRGSVKNIDAVPPHIKDLFRTVWETSQTDLIHMYAERAPFVDQSQSMNLFLASPNYEDLDKLHTLAHGLGMKTGMYYLHMLVSTTPVQFSLGAEARGELSKMYEADQGDGYDVENDDVCTTECGACSA